MLSRRTIRPRSELHGSRRTQDLHETSPSVRLVRASIRRLAPDLGSARAQGPRHRVSHTGHAVLAQPLRGASRTSRRERLVSTW